MAVSGAVADRLARLAPDQRAAATAAPGPLLCVAPAGSGKTTTLVARIAWLVDREVDPATITAITFNKRAADELAERLTHALAELDHARSEHAGPSEAGGPSGGGPSAGGPSGGVRVRTFHALGREIVMSAGVAVEPLVDRDEILRQVVPDADLAVRRRLDTAFSRLKLDLRVAAGEIAADPGAGPVARAFVAYEAALAERGALDFDDLVARALQLLETRADLRIAWRARYTHLLVDEAQDLDRSQLELALLLAAPDNRIFLVGDDDQSIYGWRLADVRRVLGLATTLPRLRRIDLETNYRCPAAVVSRAVRLIDHNDERFRKRIVPRPNASGEIVLAADGRDDTERVAAILEADRGNDGGSTAILARTNRELLPAIAVAVELGRPFRPSATSLLVDDSRVDAWLDALDRDGRQRDPLLVRLATLRTQLASTGASHHAHDALPDDALFGALLAWAAPYASLAELRGAIATLRRRVAELSRDDAPLTLATVHGTKGLEWDHVAVLGLDVGRFPSRRAVHESAEPRRALEEERRLAYVAWTRARKTLTLSYDPDAPSQFLLEAFEADELGLEDRSGAS
jgi:superfamily I DNA/RNA helicase